MKSALPPKRPRPKPTDPVAAAAEKLGATVTKLPADARDANARLDTMWKSHIQPALAALAAEDKEMAIKIDYLLSSIEQVQATMVAALYDPEAITQIEAEIKEYRAVIWAAPKKIHDLAKDLLDLSDQRQTLKAQAEDVMRPLRLNIRDAVIEKDGKIKSLFTNDTLRADALADILADNADYQAIAASLDDNSLTIALKKAELERVEGERKAASSLLWAARSRLEFATARMLTSAPRGGNDA